MKESVVVVSYAVNGSGVGHLARQIAIHRWLRRYGVALQRRVQHWFLTTSEADTMLFHEGFASLKLPSKSVVEEAGISKPAYFSLAKTWVWNALAGLRPDLLLVDTFPGGSFHELPAALDLAKKRALVLRPVKPAFAHAMDYPALCALYDLVIVPDHADDALAGALGLDEHRLFFSGPVSRREAFELLPKDAARARLGVSGAGPVVLVTAGGGGDASCAALFAACPALALRTGAHVVIAAGPLYRGPPVRGPHVSFVQDVELASCLKAFDVAVAGAGFNSVHELALAAVPVVLLPQDKIADDQEARAAAFAAAGAEVVTGALDVDVVAAAVTRALKHPRGERLHAAFGENHARSAAAAALALVLGADDVARAEEALDDEVLTRLAQAPGLSLGDVVDAAHALTAPGAHSTSLQLLPEALALLEPLVGRGVPAATTTRTATLLAKKLGAALSPKPRVHARLLAEATARLLGHPALQGQAAGLQQLIAALSPDRSRRPELLVDDVAALLDDAAAASRPLSHVADTLSARPLGQETTPRAALATLRAAWRNAGPAAASASAAKPEAAE